MPNPHRKMAFVLASSEHGTLIVNRFDYRMDDETAGHGVGFEILQKSSYEREEVGFAVSLLELRRKYFGAGVVAIDCGANIGVHTIEWAKLMTGWGSVVAIEPQERIYYALAGNIAINNCFNARAILAAVAAKNGAMKIPQPDYRAPASFGSLELRKKEANEFIGQPVDYDRNTVEVRTLSLDSLSLERIDLIKLDIEGMELEALQGALGSIEKSRPYLIVESLKSDQAELSAFLETRGYRVFGLGVNFLAVHGADRSLPAVDACLAWARKKTADRSAEP